MEGFTAGGQGPTSGCSAVEEEEEEHKIVELTHFGRDPERQS